MSRRNTHECILHSVGRCARVALVRGGPCGVGDAVGNRGGVWAALGGGGVQVRAVLRIAHSSAQVQQCNLSAMLRRRSQQAHVGSTPVGMAAAKLLTPARGASWTTFIIEKAEVLGIVPCGPINEDVANLVVTVAVAATKRPQISIS